jgi:hypothetical protein
MPQEVKSGIFSGIFTVVINTILAALLLNYLERGRRLSRLAPGPGRRQNLRK